MKYNSAVEKALKKYNIKTFEKIRNDEDSKPEHRDPKAYRRFKEFNTFYGSGKKCSYGDKKKTCDPGCRFWMSCKHGKHEYDWKGGGVDGN